MSWMQSGNAAHDPIRPPGKRTQVTTSFTNETKPGLLSWGSERENSSQEQRKAPDLKQKLERVECKLWRFSDDWGSELQPSLHGPA